MLRDRFFAAPLLVGAELGLNAEEARGLGGGIPRRRSSSSPTRSGTRGADQVRRVVPIAARAIGGECGSPSYLNDIPTSHRTAGVEGRP